MYKTFTSIRLAAQVMTKASSDLRQSADPVERIRLTSIRLAAPDLRQHIAMAARVERGKWFLNLETM
jgi:hypothetical protein